MQNKFDIIADELISLLTTNLFFMINNYYSQLRELVNFCSHKRLNPDLLYYNKVISSQMTPLQVSYDLINPLSVIMIMNGDNVMNIN